MSTKLKSKGAVVNKSIEECRLDMRASVESLDASKTDRVGSPSLGDVVRQGDLYLQCIEDLPKGTPTTNRQLVPGNTQGSRHVLEGDVEIVNGVSRSDINQVLLGPAFKCNSDVTVTHPEHGHRVLPAGTTWQCVYQQSYAEEVRRVQD